MAAKSIQLSSPGFLSPSRVLLHRRLQTPLHAFRPLHTWLPPLVTSAQALNVVTKAKTITAGRRVLSTPCLTHTIVIVMYHNPGPRQCVRHRYIRTVIFRPFQLTVPSRLVIHLHLIVCSVHFRVHLRHSHIPLCLRCPSQGVLPMLLMLLVLQQDQARERRSLSWRTIKRGWRPIIGRNPRMQLLPVYQLILLHGTVRAMRPILHHSTRELWIFDYIIWTFARHGHLRFIRVGTTGYASISPVIVRDIERRTKQPCTQTFANFEYVVSQILNPCTALLQRQACPPGT